MRTLQCPECSLSMQAFLVEVKGQPARVELDRCPRCARLWFDLGEMERTVGKAYLPRLVGGGGAWPCLACKGPTRSTLVGGEVTVDECERCRGALVEAQQIELLTGAPLKEVRSVPLAPPTRVTPKVKAAKSSRLSEFTCERCHQPTRVEQGGATKGSMRCRSCELEAQATDVSDQGARRDPVASLLESFTDAVLSLFRDV